VETKTRRDIEDKKNQLRQLVGNSYRRAELSSAHVLWSSLRACR